jgi:hypothetical protein
MTSAQHAYSLVYGLCRDHEKDTGTTQFDHWEIEVETPWGETYTVMIQALSDPDVERAEAIGADPEGLEESYRYAARGGRGQ